MYKTYSLAIVKCIVVMPVLTTLTIWHLIQNYLSTNIKLVTPVNKDPASNFEKSSCIRPPTNLYFPTRQEAYRKYLKTSIACMNYKEFVLYPYL